MRDRVCVFDLRKLRVEGHAGCDLIRELVPLTGDLGRPEDVAAAAVYLATAPFVTGAVLTVDGGWTAR